MSRPTYTVRAERDGRWWVLTVPDVPGAFSQVARLGQAAGAAAEAISFVSGAAKDTFDVDVATNLDPMLLAEVEAARLAVEDAEMRQRAAATASRLAARRLLDAGLSGRDASTVMGVSPQRLSQLTKAS